MGCLLYGPGLWLNLMISGPLLILAIKANERAIFERFVGEKHPGLRVSAEGDWGTGVP